MTRYAVVHGPRSGRRGAGVTGEMVVHQLRSHGHQVHQVETSSLSMAREASRLAVADGVDVLVAVGGDGVVQLAANAAAGSDTALGVIPSGTGNDNARSLGIPLDAEKAVHVLLAGQRRRIDLLHIDPTDHHVVGSVPCGLDALIAARADTLPRWLGSHSYAVATLPEIARIRPMTYDLQLDGTSLNIDALIVAVCNMPVYGGGMRIAPDADPCDGLADVVIIEPVGAREALGLLRSVFTGKHVEHRAVRMERAARVRVAGPTLVAQGDGEPIGPLPIDCRVLPGALDVLTPTTA